MKEVRSIVELRMPLVRFQVARQMPDEITTEQAQEWAESIAPVIVDMLMKALAHMIARSAQSGIDLAPGSEPVRVNDVEFTLT